jgi:surface polysaccharide O-acyltransferase-like enzyme
MKRIEYGDILRIIATFAVVLLHMVANKWAFTDYTTNEWDIYNIINSGVRWCVPIFIMLSGMIFLNPKRKITTKQMYSKYILRVLVALIFWGLFYQVIDLILVKGEFNLPVLKDMILRIGLGKSKYHLWFLYTIIALYVLVPIIRVYIRTATRKEIEYFLIIIFAMSCIYPVVNYFLPVKAGYNLPVVSEYIGMFVLGYYLSEFDFSEKYKLVIYLLGICAFVATVKGTALASVWKSTPNTILFMYYAPNVMIMAMSIFVFIKSVFSKVNLSKKVSKIISYVSSCTFGVYLLHPLFLGLLEKNKIAIRLSNVIPLTIGICIVCFIITSIIKLIPGIKKYII